MIGSNFRFEFNILIKFNLGLSNDEITIKNYQLINSKRNVTLDLQQPASSQRSSNFLKIEKLIFKNYYDFKFDTIRGDIENLAGLELRLNLNLFELIDLKRRNNSSRRVQLRQPIHDLEVNIFIFEQKINKVFQNKKDQNFISYKLLMNKTVKVINNISQRDFFQKVKETSKQSILFDLSRSITNLVKSSKRLHFEFKVYLKTNSHVYSLAIDKLKNVIKQVPTLATYLNDGTAKMIQKEPKLNIQKNIRNKNCDRKPWKINFKDIGWDRFIIRPTELNVYYCNGLCEGPFDNSLNASNHAIMQYFATNSGSYNFLPRICCVPTSYTSEYFLIRDSKHNIVIKLIDDIIVETCGCR
jgi:hypothetical protein